MPRLLSLLAAVAAVAATSSSSAPSATRCAPAPAGAAATKRGSAQLVTVTAATTASTTATLQLWDGSGGCWRSAAGPWNVYVGVAGLSEHHHEGDGTTPVGMFRLGPVVYGVGPNPGVHLRYHRLVCGDWWDEDPASPTYNSFRHVPCGARPTFGGSSERLWRSTRAYRLLAFVEYNVPAVAGRGSAIFIHADLGHATNGCISLQPQRLVEILRWLRPGRRPFVAIGTAAQLSSF